MSELLKGIYFDEVDKIRILNPDVTKHTTNLKEICQIYIEKIDEFQKIAGKFIDMINLLKKEIENEKIKAIGARNVMQSMEKEKENNQQQLQALIVEKTLELERLKAQYNSLQKSEIEQNDIINELFHY